MLSRPQARPSKTVLQLQEQPRTNIILGLEVSGGPRCWIMHVETTTVRFCLPELRRTEELLLWRRPLSHLPFYEGPIFMRNCTTGSSFRFEVWELWPLPEFPLLVASCLGVQSHIRLQITKSYDDKTVQCWQNLLVPGRKIRNDRDKVISTSYQH